MSGGGGMGVGMATNIIGSEMERWANILAADAMNSQFQSQMNLQNKFRQQGMGAFNQYAPSLSAETAEQQMQDASKQRQAAYGQVAQLQPGATVDPAIAAALKLQGQQRADVGSLGDWQNQQAIASSQLGDVLNRIGYRAKGAAQVFPYQMSAAQHSMDWLNMLGEMIKGVGGGAANFSMLSQQGQPAPTGNQYMALQQGYGPVNAQYANQLYNPYSPTLGGTTTTSLMGY